MARGIYTPNPPNQIDNQLLRETRMTIFFPVKIHLLVNNLSDIFALTWIPSIV